MISSLSASNFKKTKQKTVVAFIILYKVRALWMKNRNRTIAEQETVTVCSKVPTDPDRSIRTTQDACTASSSCHTFHTICYPNCVWYLSRDRHLHTKNPCEQAELWYKSSHEIWSQIMEAPRTRIRSESCSTAKQGESTIQAVLTVPEPSRNDPRAFELSLSETHMHTWPHTNEFQNVFSQSLQPLKHYSHVWLLGFF